MGPGRRYGVDDSAHSRIIQLMQSKQSAPTICVKLFDALLLAVQAEAFESALRPWGGAELFSRRWAKHRDAVRDALGLTLDALSVEDKEGAPSLSGLQAASKDCTQDTIKAETHTCCSHQDANEA